MLTCACVCLPGFPGIYRASRRRKNARYVRGIPNTVAVRVLVCVRKCVLRTHVRVCPMRPGHRPRLACLICTPENTRTRELYIYNIYMYLYIYTQALYSSLRISSNAFADIMLTTTLTAAHSFPDTRNLIRLRNLMGVLFLLFLLPIRANELIKFSA